MAVKLKIINLNNNSLGGVSTPSSPISKLKQGMSGLYSLAGDVGLAVPSNNNPNEFTALVNPSSLSLSSSINYDNNGGNTDSVGGNTDQSNIPVGIPVGQSHAYPRYQNSPAENLTFKLILDGTGALGVATKSPSYVNSEIKHLKKVVYDYQGQNHEPNRVMVVWGDLNFDSKLKSMSINYKLFNISGQPLRAELNLAFISATPPEEAEKIKNNSSPDLSHVKVVRAGDTLPKMCQSIYNDSKMYLEVARINGLVNFRNLKPGTEILFPPIKK